MTDFLSTSQVAELLGISRIAVFKKIKSGQIKATKVGKNYAVDREDLGGIFKKGISKTRKKEIKDAIKKTIKDYGEVLRMLKDT